MARSRAHPPHPLKKHRQRGDRGSQFVEFAGFLPLVLITVVMSMELFASFLAMERLENAARNGARVAAEQGTQAGTDAARDSLPGWLSHAEVTSGFDDGTFYLETSAKPPFMYPAAEFDFEISRRVDMPAL